jgi:methylated-DNA-[protein]-cysteine S-methyltransferase
MADFVAGSCLAASLVVPTLGRTLAAMVAHCLRYEVEGWGVGELWLDGATVLAHALPSPARSDDVRPPGGVSSPARTVADEASRSGADFVPDLLRRIRGHLGGRRTEYTDLPLDLEWCTAFQDSLARALRSVPWGDVVSYGELAALAGRPRAARAAGTFCAENRFSLFLPCHRVVAANGIGGYGDTGVEVKRRLLALEDVVL